MTPVYLTGIQIDHVRHLKNIFIPISDTEKKHLILTGRNGSGKTSLLVALKKYLTAFDDQQTLFILEECPQQIKKYYDECKKLAAKTDAASKKRLLETQNRYQSSCDVYNYHYAGALAQFNSLADAVQEYTANNFIIAFYKADRVYEAIESKHIEKVQLSDRYKIEERPAEAPGKQLVKYLRDLKTSAALAAQGGKTERAESIAAWFNAFENLLRRIFQDDTLTLEFDIDTFQFFIHQMGHEPFGFNQLSSGYSAILDIVGDLMIRMEKHSKNLSYQMQGIVLIDEIDTHLHLELQKLILPILTEFFPGIQFIVSTHSPFILNSIENAVVYDLEKQTIIDESMTAFSYEDIVEGYFEESQYSLEAQEKFEQYKSLAEKKERTDAENQQLFALKRYFEKLPYGAARDLQVAFREMEERRLANGG